MIKQILNFSQDRATGKAIIEIYMLTTDAVRHIEAIKVLIEDGAIIQTVDANTIRAVYKDTNQNKLLELIESGWTFASLDVITEGGLICVRTT